MFKITYDITDAKDVNYRGVFCTNWKTAKHISKKIAAKHPEISVPFKSHNVKVNKI